MRIIYYSLSYPFRELQGKELRWAKAWICILRVPEDYFGEGGVQEEKKRPRAELSILKLAIGWSSLFWGVLVRTARAGVGQLPTSYMRRYNNKYT